MKLGEGSFGKVLKVEKNGNTYALKKIENISQEGVRPSKELDIMTRISHPNLMNAKEIHVEYKDDNIITEIYMDVAEKDLYHKIRENLNFSLNSRLKILYQVVQGLKFLHDSNYLHLDIKPLNILIFKNDVAKLSDFGLSLILEKDKGYKYFPNTTMTIDHRSIECLNGNRNYTKADDIWSLGITFIETLSYGRSLFSGFKKEDFTTEKVKEVIIKYLSPDVIKNTLKVFFSLLKSPIQKEAINLVSKMLSFDPKKRPSVEEIIKNPLFSSIKLLKGKEKRISPSFYKFECDYLAYEGYDLLVRMSTRITISLETFFLAVDIYQRILPFRHNLTGNEEIDYKNTVYLAAISLYMAAKMIESYFIDPNVIADLAGNLFKGKNILQGEVFIINSLKGIIYPDNLFTSSSSLDRLLDAFEVSRNCFLYPYIDLKEWKKLNGEDKFEKYIPFNTFVGRTRYYKLIKEDTNDDREYVKILYEEDKNK